MEVAFVNRPDGGVDARVVGGDSMFDEVFADSINAIAPSGAPEPTAPSTYWIDRARAYALAANEEPTANPIAHGNVTIVTVENGSVVARFDFDPDDEPGEAIAVGEFIAILDRWRFPRVLHELNPLPVRGPRTAGPAWYLVVMDSSKIWSAEELEKMSPNERQSLVRAGFETDLSKVSPELLERTRRKIESHIASNQDATTPDR